MKLKDNILLILKNLAPPAGIAGLVIAIAIPVLIALGPNCGFKEAIRQLDLYLPLPLFLVQLATGVTLLALLHKDLREWLKGILPAKSFSIVATVFAVAIAIFSRIASIGSSRSPVPCKATTIGYFFAGS